MKQIFIIKLLIVCINMLIIIIYHDTDTTFLVSVVSSMNYFVPIRYQLSYVI